MMMLMMMLMVGLPGKLLIRSPHLFFFTLNAKQPPKITWVLQFSNVSETYGVWEENACQLIKSPTRARTRLCFGQQTGNELAASYISVPLTVPDRSTFPTTPYDFAH